jgi:hypothetical protein
MASIKNLNKAILKEPEAAGTRVERQDSVDKEFGEAPVTPKTAGPAGGKISPSPDPFSNRRRDARPVSGKSPRPTDKPGE